LLFLQHFIHSLTAVFFLQAFREEIADDLRRCS